MRDPTAASPLRAAAAEGSPTQPDLSASSGPVRLPPVEEDYYADDETLRRAGRQAAHELVELLVPEGPRADSEQTRKLIKDWFDLCPSDLDVFRALRELIEAARLAVPSNDVTDVQLQLLATGTSIGELHAYGVRTVLHALAGSTLLPAGYEDPSWLIRPAAAVAAVLVILARRPHQQAWQTIAELVEPRPSLELPVSGTAAERAAGGAHDALMNALSGEASVTALASQLATETGDQPQTRRLAIDHLKGVVDTRLHWAVAAKGDPPSLFDLVQNGCARGWLRNSEAELARALVAEELWSYCTGAPPADYQLCDTPSGLRFILGLACTVTVYLP